MAVYIYNCFNKKNAPCLKFAINFYLPLVTMLVVVNHAGGFDLLLVTRQGPI